MSSRCTKMQKKKEKKKKYWSFEASRKKLDFNVVK